VSGTIDVADRLALHELAAAYGEIVDAKDWAGLAQIFTEDAVFDMSDIGLGEFHGLAAIRGHMTTTDRHPRAHLIVNVRVVEGDPVGLRSRVIGVLPDRRVAVGSYRDHVERTVDGWRVRHRIFTAGQRADGSFTGTESPRPAWDRGAQR
jgi:3-phenylpropionate/cinnamic acid dioxygenase small subunit